MSDDEPTRRSILRSTAVGASGLAVGTLASTATASAAACDGATETTTRTGSLSGADDADTLTYDAATSDPCEVAFDLASEDATDFDLYVTYDGRTPTTSDFDARSKTSLTSGERVTVDAENADANATFGVLVDSYTNGGSWTLDVTETTADDGGGGGNERPTASFTASATTVTVGDAVDVDASDSTDPDGSVASYAWTFGDGAGADGQTASHAYDTAGEYEVTLTVTDDDGATDTATKPVTVESGGGDCNVTRTRTEEGTLDGTGAGSTYQYAARTADPCEVTLSLSADAGTDFDLYVTYDGRTPTTADYDDRSYNYGSDEEIVVEGSAFGAKDVLGVLVDAYDGSGSFALDIEEVGTGDGDGPAPNDPPTATFTVDAATVSVDDPVTVDASDSTDADGSIASYDWTFGDDATASGESATHAYAAVGEYAVTLTVTDDDGATDTATRTVTVESGDDCGSTRETAGTEGRFWWSGGSEDYTYETQTSDPCEVTVTVDGPSAADFDLYVTLDGRTPTTSDYDVRSASADAQEAVTTDSVDATTSMGLLVVAADGSGTYRLDVDELGR
ncbi:PKD domain-containing protein [Halorubellus sp. PRR65]|uniref:PKD domain-containing protein n=1 Tax=Halorubellus sp. PRR65 TaxID=3098148 RepID=UPI002B257494|nr:PKD domain-containing protein [Halorubellus sp. PRR65]